MATANAIRTLPTSLLRMRNIPRRRGQLPAFDSLVFFLHPRNPRGVLFQPQRDRRAHALLVQVHELDDDVFARVGAEIVQLAHVDAVGGAGLGAEGAEETLAVVDRVADQLATLGIDLAGFLVDLARTGFVDVDAINGAGFGAHVAGD